MTLFFRPIIDVHPTSLPENLKRKPDFFVCCCCCCCCCCCGGCCGCCCVVVGVLAWWLWVLWFLLLWSWLLLPIRTVEISRSLLLTVRGVLPSGNIVGWTDPPRGAPRLGSGWSRWRFRFLFSCATFLVIFLVIFRWRNSISGMFCLWSEIAVSNFVETTAPGNHRYRYIYMLFFNNLSKDL